VTHSIRFAPAAQREFDRLPREARRRLRPRIDALAEEPRPQGAKTLSGLKGALAIRVGDYRVVYRVDGEQLEVLIVRVAHRREVYRRL